MLDDILLITLICIIAATIIGTFLSGRSKDRCLASFGGFMVTLLEKGGRRVWGRLDTEASGLELVYSADYLDQDHIETSYIVFKEEFNTIYLLIRFHSELSEVNKRRRLREVKRAYHPSPLRLLGRKARNVINTFKDSIFEILGLVMTKATTANPAMASLASQQKRVTKVQQDVVGTVGRSYDAVLEKHIGKRVVLEVTTPDGKVQEHVGIFKDYSSQFLQVMDVSYPDGEETRVCDIIVPRAHGFIRHGAETTRKK